MPRVVEAITQWARRTTSSFAELVGDTGFAQTELQAPPTCEPIYRLREWPLLPASMRTADVLRLLSLMSTRPVNRHWMVQHSRLPEKKIDRLLERLAAQRALEVIDPSGFASLPDARRH
jgi:hypothetical protein